MENFDRQYRLTLGDYTLGAATEDQPIPLRISFSLQKTDLEAGNTGRLSVYNLGPVHLSALDRTDCPVSLRAGYGNRLPLIFSGTVSFASTAAEGADRRTDIEAVDQLPALRDAYLSLSYSGSVSWRTILDDAANRMGVAVRYSYNAAFTDAPRGFSYVGKAAGILTRGCGCCGLVWSIQNGVLQIKRPGDVMRREVYVLSPETGLLGSPERVAVNAGEDGGETRLGWDAEYFLNGAITVDDYVYLQSRAATGYFRVYSVEYTGDNLGGDWKCRARLLEVESG